MRASFSRPRSLRETHILLRMSPAQNADQPFIPASVAKIVTAWLAMEILGGDYRFETRFYLDGDQKLYVRGGGDPLLIIEELAQLAPDLVAAIGKEPVTGIVLDASYYPSDLRMLRLVEHRPCPSCAPA
jgi:serine-type D-Ala-D-Ala carboxypeptidase/endopeptidase (penicillin-binding protein 4)